MKNNTIDRMKSENEKWTPSLFTRTVELTEYKDKISAHITWRGLDMNYLSYREDDAIAGLMEKVQRMEKSLNNHEWNIGDIKIN